MSVPDTSNMPTLPKIRLQEIRAEHQSMKANWTPEAVEDMKRLHDEW